MLKAIRDLAHVHFVLIEAASRVNGYGFNVPESSLDPAFDQPLLETLVLEGHPIAGVEWYPEDYFDRLMALKHLTINNGSRMQSVWQHHGIEGLLSSHSSIVQLHRHGIILQTPIRKPSLCLTVALFNTWISVYA